jgi:tripartite-type tricarboxylate transporter receptor subunit TctC
VIGQSPTGARRRIPRIAAVLLGAVALLLSACGGGQAASPAAPKVETFPTRAIELTVPFNAGGSTDLIGRAFAKAMEKRLSTTMPVVNKPGSNGAAGTKDVLGSTADGYRIVVVAKSQMSITPLVINDPSAIKLDQMSIISPLTIEDLVQVVPADSPYKTIQDLLGADELKYGTSGVGSASHLAQALLFGAAHVPASVVGFDGGAPTIGALLSHQVPTAALHIAEAAPQIEAGKLRPLVVYPEKRIPFMKDIPTVRELGYDVVVDQRRFLAAPAGLPPDVLATLREAADKAKYDMEYTLFLQKNYISAWEGTVDDVVPHLQESSTKYADQIKAFGATFAKP